MKIKLIYFMAAIAIVPFFGNLAQAQFLKPKNHLWEASFRRDFNRYPSPTVIFLTLKKLFPNSSASGENLDFCFSNDENSMSALGDNKPATGSPLTEDPSIAFTSVYSQIISCLIKKEIVFSYQENGWALNEFANSEILKALGYSGSSSGIGSKTAAFGYQTSYTQLTENQQKQFIKDIVIKIIGPDEVIKDYQFANGIDEIVNNIHTTLAKMIVEKTRVDFLLVDLGQRASMPAAWSLIYFMTLMLDAAKY